MANPTILLSDGKEASEEANKTRFFIQQAMIGGAVDEISVCLLSSPKFAVARLLRLLDVD